MAGGADPTKTPRGPLRRVGTAQDATETFTFEGGAPMIEVRDVRKSFPSGGRQVAALRGVSTSVPEGSCAFIVGPSGSGKSTLLYLLGAMDRPTSGTIRVDGRELTAMTGAEQDAYRRERVGFIFQAFN